MLTFTRRSRGVAVAAGLAAAALVLAGCGGGGSSSGGQPAGGASSKPLTIGTTDKITFLDPAGSYDNGSGTVINQVFPELMNTPYGSPDPQPDIAE
jgi:peptide/nickel transport system substrate-binding protein